MYSVIITDYRTIDNSINYIKQFANACKDSIHFLVVDNSNRKDGYRYIKKHQLKYETNIFKGKNVYTFLVDSSIQITLMDAGCNGGYAVGNNLGASYAKHFFKDKYYIFSNTDLELPEYFSLHTLADYIEKDSSIGIIGPDILSPTGERQSPRKNKGFISQMILWDINILVLKNALTKWIWNLDIDNHGGETDWISGSFMFINAYAFNQVGGFDENTFLYAEEMIISKRMRIAGFKTYFAPDFIIIHHHKGTQSRNSRKILHHSKRYYYKQYENTNILLLLLSDIIYNLSEFILLVKHDVVINAIRKIARWK